MVYAVPGAAFSWAMDAAETHYDPFAGNQNGNCTETNHLATSRVQFVVQMKHLSGLLY